MGLSGVGSTALAAACTAEGAKKLKGASVEAFPQGDRTRALQSGTTLLPSFICWSTRDAYIPRGTTAVRLLLWGLLEHGMCTLSELTLQKTELA